MLDRLALPIITIVVIAAIYIGVRYLNRRAKAASPTMQRLVREGVPATGTVFSLRKERVRRDYYRYYLSYRFVGSDGKEYTPEVEVDSGGYGRVSEGDSVDVLYLADQPWNSDTRENVDALRSLVDRAVT